MNRGSSRLRVPLACTLLCAAALPSGCAQTDSSASASNDGGKARAVAAAKIAAMQRDANERVPADANDASDASRVVEQAQSQAAYATAAARAEVNYQVGRLGCEAQSGDAQLTCIDRAGADLDAARAQARAVLAR